MTASNGQFTSYLDSNQQDLLTAALNSNSALSSGGVNQQFGNDALQTFFDSMDPSLFLNTNNLAMPDFNNFGSIEDSPYLENFGDDANFDFNKDGRMIGNLPGDDDDDDEDHLHDKRKSPEGEKEDNENAGKRREGEVKEAKKPGRKPLTSEPTNKRKAQNRAAQRAFRERKEKHLRDLETKVADLEKASEAANHENGLLRAQVERLQIELREYRRRLSMSTGLMSRSQPMGGSMFLPGSVSTVSNSSFQFEFPKFGSLPGGIFGNSTSGTKDAINGNSKPSNGVLARNGSSTSSMSPRSQLPGSGSLSSRSSPQTNGSTTSNVEASDRSNKSVSSIFTPAAFNDSSALSFDNWVTTTTSAEPESTASVQQNPSRIFQFNNSSNNSTASPGSTSSASQYGGAANSSCGTSPEPSHNSPKNNTLDTISECKTVQTSEGANVQQSTEKTSATKDSDFNYFAAMANQNGGGFDPQLFDTYREPQNAIVGDGDFTGGFFNDAMPASDFAGPFDWANITAPTGLTPFLPKTNPLEVADALQAGGDDEEVVPADEPGSLMTCHKIWDKLQERPDFKDGSLDIDGLCSELRAKARCSESGVVIDQKDVDSALKRLSPSTAGSGAAPPA
ncbi:hypothetical protein, variant 3 [Verruconis gallopava]|uniref:BZIP domain-containing protein n=1 Tax=Verruconis gallopava TaxID=253628 RepID=A0A0D2ABH9_9PEZI|nr:hypothetical protein, variant 3 [Verruconis gallopava]KIW04173.1 hypothetical protein, variant 3 [Verruconis gallopava]